MDDHPDFDPGINTHCHSQSDADKGINGDYQSTNGDDHGLNPNATNGSLQPKDNDARRNSVEIEEQDALNITNLEVLSNPTENEEVHYQQLSFLSNTPSQDLTNNVGQLEQHRKEHNRAEKTFPLKSENVNQSHCLQTIGEDVDDEFDYESLQKGKKTHTLGSDEQTGVSNNGIAIKNGVYKEPQVINDSIECENNNSNEANENEDSDTLQKMENHEKIQMKFDDNDYSKMRLDKVNAIVAFKVLRLIWNWGTQMGPDMSFKEYLIDVKQVKKYNSVFNKEQREKLEKDISGSSFDVTLLYACIKYACDNLAPPNSTKWTDEGDSLERTLTNIKNFRNYLAHNKNVVNTYIKKLESLRNDLNKALQLAGEIYSIDPVIVENHVDDINNSINAFRDQAVSELNIDNYRTTEMFKSLMEILLTDGKQEINEIYKKFCDFNPVSFITGKEFHLNVGLVFTQIELIKEQKNQTSQNEKPESINYNDLLKADYEEKVTNKIKVLEGPAGSGKSTVTRKIMNDWVKGNSEMIDLTTFDLMLFMECKDSTNSTFLEFLTSLMPKTSVKFRDRDLEKFVLDRKLLIIVDGLDELNASSTRLFQSIINLRRRHDITLFCTTRPEKIEDCYKMMTSGEKTMHMKVIGIPDSRREEFARKYHEEMRRIGMSKQETRGLIEYLQRSSSHLREQWRLPLNLLLLTVLWADAPEKVNCVTTPTELYYEIHRLTMEKLLVRLKCNEQTSHMSVRKLETKVEQFLVTLCCEALQGLKNDEIMLSDLSIFSLKRACDKAGLPEEEVFGAFLVRKIMWTSKGTQYKISYPHRGIQDFMGALVILLKLKQKGINLEIKGLINSDLEILQPQMELCTKCMNDSHVYTSRSANVFSRALHKINKRASRMRAVMRRERPFWSGRVSGLTRARNFVSDPFLNLWEEYFEKTTLLSDILEEMYTKNEEIQYHKFNNTFVHLTGLLQLTTKIIMKKEFVEELVTLLQKSGIKKKEEWLDLISNVKCDHFIAGIIAKKIPSIIQENITVKDTRVYSYASIFQSKCPQLVNIDITARPSDIPRLDELLSILSERECEVSDLEFHEEFQYPSRVTSSLDWAVQRIFQNCNVKNYRGVMSSRLCPILPPSLEKLRVGIGNAEEYSKLCRILSSPSASFKRLALHLDKEIDYNSLIPIPVGLYVHLYLSDLDSTTIEWACNTALKLQPVANLQKRGFVTILFPRCKMEVEDFELLLEEFANAGVRVSSAICTSASIPFDRAEALQGKARSLLKVDFRLIPDFDLWRKW